MLTVDAGSVALSKGVSTPDKSNRFCVVHAHTSENIADVCHTVRRLRDTHMTLGIDVDKAYHNRPQRLLAVALLFAGI